MKVNGKTIVVTGAGSGMGRELVLLLVKKGARVAAVDRNEKSAEETKQLAGKDAARISVHALDITDRAAAEALLPQVIAAHGSADGLINNAGIIQPFIKVNALDFATIERVMNVNFYGMLYLTKTFLPHFLKQKEAHIVNISSMGGFLPVPGQTVYGASKAAVKLFTEGLHSELRGTNVHATIIFPGAIKTNISANSGVAPIGATEPSKESSKIKMLEADEAARQIIEAMETNAFRACVGKDSKFLDRLYRLAPRYAADFIAKKMEYLLK